MTGSHSDDPASIRLLCDGGREPKVVTKTRQAKDVVTREVNGDDQEMLRVPISSTRADREGDRFAKEALDGMADQIRSEQPMVFDNHGLAGGWMDAIPYDSRETIGAQMDAEVEEADDGESDLYAYVNPDGTHDEGDRMIRQVRDEGQPIKFSVGFGIKGYDDRAEVEDDYQGDGRVFTSVDQMETSRVGIPANPDASVTQSMAAKSGGSDGLPGYANHPVFQMMQMMQGGGVQTKDAVTSETVEDGTPVRVDGGKEPDDPPVSELLTEVRALREEVAELKSEDEGETKGSCEVDTDCPEGEVCLEGECVPEDEVDDDDDDEDDDSARSPEDVPDVVREMREEQRALREEIDDLRDGGLQRGDSKTGDTDMSQTVERDDDPDETTDDDELGDTTNRGLLFDN